MFRVSRFTSLCSAVCFFYSKVTHLVYCVFASLCLDSGNGKKSAAPVLEAPGAAEIGLVGVGICCALIAAIMMLDLVSIHKHFAFLRKNTHFCRQRLCRSTSVGQRRNQRSLMRQSGSEQLEDETKQVICYADAY